MNRQECDVLLTLYDTPGICQREVALKTNHSLGIVNRSIQSLTKAGYLEISGMPTEKARIAIEESKPKRAIILAAGFGMRMVPINTETPKALLEVKGERLIERQIRQLHEAGIFDIIVVVGFMKERFEYLIDSYGVRIIVNPEYARKNNLHSLKLANEYLENAYIMPCDIWFRQNPFRFRELYPWYMVSDTMTQESTVRVNRKMELVSVGVDEEGNAAVGLAYLCGNEAGLVRLKIDQLSAMKRYDSAFWEEALFEHDRMRLHARIVNSEDAIEINTYEELRELDSGSDALQSEALAIIGETLNVSRDEIKDISVLKKGMTNRSFLFSVRGKKYIMRIPGEGTDLLINRREEAAVYEKVNGMSICDPVLYINPENGYKITEFMDGARVCDPDSENDLKRCMQKLRAFHELGLEVQHRFDIFGQIEYYESLWPSHQSVYRDYEKTKENVYSMRSVIEQRAAKWTLTHIDAVPDNFLFVPEKCEEQVRLIDWEYAGMQDPHVDIAMFSIYALYDREKIDRLIDIYFDGACTERDRTKIYCYIAACGLLWSNWCEYKSSLGVEYGEYSIRQYRYAKDFYRIAAERIKYEEE